jgi:hypothetical protein
MTDEPQRNVEDLKDGIEDLIALADDLGLSLIGALLSTTLAALPTSVRH